MAVTALESAVKDLFPPGQDLEQAVKDFLSGTAYLGFNAEQVFLTYRSKFRDAEIFATTTLGLLLLSTQTGANPEKRLSRNVGDAQVAKKAIALYKAAGIQRRPDQASDVTLPRLEIIFLHILIDLRKLLMTKGALRQSIVSSSPTWSHTPAANGVYPESDDFQKAFAERLQAAKLGKPLDDTAKAAVKLRVSEFAELNKSGWRIHPMLYSNTDMTKLIGIRQALRQVFEGTVPAPAPTPASSSAGSSTSSGKKKAEKSGGGTEATGAATSAP